MGPPSVGAVGIHSRTVGGIGGGGEGVIRAANHAYGDEVSVDKTDGRLEDGGNMDRRGSTTTEPSLLAVRGVEMLAGPTRPNQ